MSLLYQKRDADFKISESITSHLSIAFIYIPPNHISEGSEGHGSVYHALYCDPYVAIAPICMIICLLSRVNAETDH